MNKCLDCTKDLAKEPTITAIQGMLFCNKCATKRYTEQELLELSEQVVPSDIGILPECEWCGEEHPSTELHITSVGLLCATCVKEMTDCDKEIKDLSNEPAYTCRLCNQTFAASQWNESTIALCTNRADRRKYVPIEKATKEKWYKCPGCKKRHNHKPRGVK